MPYKLKPIVWTPNTHPLDSLSTWMRHAIDTAGFDPGRWGFATAHETLGQVKLLLARGMVAGGTGMGDEAYVAFLSDTAVTPTKLWSARAYHYETPWPDSLGQAFAVAECLLIADDTLLAYGVRVDTTKQAHEFADREHVAATVGYYRYDTELNKFVFVAREGPAFASTCEAQADAEQRSMRR